MEQPPTNLEEVQELYKAHIGKHLGNRLGEVVELDIKNVRPVEGVYQPRLIEGNKTNVDESHVLYLTKRVKEIGSLDPVVGLPIGKEVILLDGHHRLVAYKRAGAQKIPCQIFKGSPEDAIRFSISENQKARLQMASIEKHQRAWELMFMSKPDGAPLFRNTEIHKETGASKALVSKMKKVIAEFKKADIDCPSSWKQAQLGLIAMSDKNIDWEGSQLDADADALAIKIRKAVPVLNTSYKRRMFAEAIARVSPQTFPEVLKYLLDTDDAEEVIEEILEQRALEERERSELDF
jgi:uncharacterized ParB-like nuclease family protein